MNSCESILKGNIKMLDDFSDKAVNRCSYDFDTNSSPQNLNQNASIPYTFIDSLPSIPLKNVNTKTFVSLEGSYKYIQYFTFLIYTLVEKIY